MNDLRDPEERQHYLTSDGGGSVSVDLSAEIDLGAWLSLIRTLIVCVVLGGGAMLFSDSSEKLIVDPIEKMLDKIDKI